MGKTYDQLDEALQGWIAAQHTFFVATAPSGPGATADDRVVVRWHQRGRSPAGLCFDGQALGLYEVRQERLARAQMFYFDTDAVNSFLADAAGQRPASRPFGPPAPGR